MGSPYTDPYTMYGSYADFGLANKLISAPQHSKLTASFKKYCGPQLQACKHSNQGETPSFCLLLLPLLLEHTFPPFRYALLRGKVFPFFCSVTFPPLFSLLVHGAPLFFAPLFSPFVCRALVSVPLVTCILFLFCPLRLSSVITCFPSFCHSVQPPPFPPSCDCTVQATPKRKGAVTRQGVPAQTSAIQFLEIEM